MNNVEQQLYDMAISYIVNKNADRYFEIIKVRTSTEYIDLILENSDKAKKIKRI